MNAPTIIREPAVRPARFTGDEYMRMLDAGLFEGRRIELARGELLETSPAHAPHGKMVLIVGAGLLSSYGRQDYDVATDIVTWLQEDDIRAPDVAVRRRSDERTFRIEETLLSVEVADATLPIDLSSKALAYAQAELANYWVVDVQAEVTHVMTGPTPGGYARRRVVPFADALPLPGIDATITLA